MAFKWAIFDQNRVKIDDSSTYLKINRLKRTPCIKSIRINKNVRKWVKMCVRLIQSAKIYLQAKIWIILLLHFLKNLHKYISAIYWQNYKLHFQPFIRNNWWKCKQSACARSCIPILLSYFCGILRRRLNSSRSMYWTSMRYYVAGWTPAVVCTGLLWDTTS